MNLNAQLAKRNMALTTRCYDAENLIEISVGGDVLITAGEPAGPGGTPTEFRIWEGEVAEDDSANVLETIDVSKFESVMDAWAFVANRAYSEALVRARVIAAEARKVIC